MLLSRHQNGGQNHDIKIADRFFENVSQFTYLGTTVTNFVALVRERTIPTKRPPLISEVSAIFCG
jgi:hypothetical protein